MNREKSFVLTYSRMSDRKVDTDNENNDEENDEKGSYQKQWLRNQHILIVRVFDLKTREKFLLNKINFQVKMCRFFSYLEILNVIIDCVFLVYDNHWSTSRVQIGIVKLVLLSLN